MPKRIQRQRTKGWKMPPNTVYVGRPTRWGNPHVVSRDQPAEESVEKYRRLWLDFFAEDNTAHDRLRRNLGGKDLACWCPLDKPCHADVLLEFANQ